MKIGRCSVGIGDDKHRRVFSAFIKDLCLPHGKILIEIEEKTYSLYIEHLHKTDVLLVIEKI